MIVNRTDLSQILGISLPTVTAWMGDGMPFVKGGGKGKQFEFDSVACIEWWADNKRRRPRGDIKTDPFAEPGDEVESYEQAERRKMVAQADKAELDLANAAGLVVKLTDVEAVIAEMHVKVRTRLLAIANKVRVAVTPHLAGDKQAVEDVVVIVEDTVTEAMAEIRDKPFEDDEAPVDPQ